MTVDLARSEASQSKSFATGNVAYKQNEINRSDIATSFEATMATHVVFTVAWCRLLLDINLGTASMIKGDIERPGTKTTFVRVL